MDDDKEKNTNNSKNTEFDFCKVCKLNHDQGRRHNYFPNFKKSLSSFLFRFLNKLSDVRFFLKNPIFLRSEHTSSNRLWCVFCDSDIEELVGLHLKNLKDFLWRYGGGVERVDSFRVSDSDLAQWERRCGVLKSSFSSSASEKSRATNDLEVQRDGHHTHVDYSKSSVGWPPRNGEVGRLGDLESQNQVLQSLKQISPALSGVPKADVHLGAPPPWLDKNELNIQVSTGLHAHDKKSGKSQKLNPKRVGTAWAEKRKIELEMEKRGEGLRNSFDANWLPNFGRVWQLGSRKESRKESVMEKPSPVELDKLSETPIKLQPYISKRMRKDAGGSKDDTNDHFEGPTNNLQ